MPLGQGALPVLKLDRTTELHLPGGVVIHVVVPSPGAANATRKARGPQGRPPSVATLKLRQVLEDDRAKGRERPRSAYRAILAEAGHSGSAASANLIVTRECKRILGKAPLRGQVAPVPKGRRGRGPSIEAELLRERLKQDAASGNLRDAAHYVRWLVDQRGVSKGLKQLRPVVYRELRNHRHPAGR